jgi:glycosyltransferase involved in cell wall biosynthesis
MKLLFVGTHYGGGGTESHFITLSKAMLAAGHEVAAVVRPDTPIHNALVGSGVKLYSGVFRNAFDPRGILAVWRAISAFEPDWMIGSFSKEYWPLAVIARLRGVKLALFKHMDYPLRFFTHHFIPRLAHRFIVISKFMRSNFVTRGVDATRIQMLYNPLDLDYFKPDAQLRKTSRAQFGFADDDIVIGFIGAMHPDKGMLPLCDAINQAMTINPKLKAIWVGDGLAVQDLKVKIQNGGFAARHIWHTWAKDVRPYYAAIDMLAAPTLVTETFGRVSIEAQACGVPVLCSNLGGLPETMQPDITGKLLPVGDVAIWRDTILNLAQDAQLREQFQNKGREWVSNNFSTMEIAKQFEKLLGQAD